MTRNLSQTVANRTFECEWFIESQDDTIETMTVVCGMTTVAVAAVVAAVIVDAVTVAVAVAVAVAAAAVVLAAARLNAAAARPVAVDRIQMTTTHVAVARRRRELSARVRLITKIRERMIPRAIEQPVRT